MFDRVETEKLGDEITVIQLVMHFARNDGFFQASVKQELFTIFARRDAEAVASYGELPPGYVHSVSPAIVRGTASLTLKIATPDMPIVSVAHSDRPVLEGCGFRSFRNDPARPLSGKALASGMIRRLDFFREDHATTE